jgi:membrane-associated phospholipid phosphatase
MQKTPESYPQDPHFLQKMRVWWVLAGAAVCWLLLLALALTFAGDRRAGEPDRAAAGFVHHVFGPPDGVALRVLIVAAEPPVLFGVVLVAAAALSWLRRWRLAALVVAAPLLAVALVELIKPLAGRRYENTYLCMPSGHTAAAMSIFTVLLIAVWPTRWRWPGVACWLVLSVAAGVGLIGENYHYLTDVAGGICVAFGTLLPLSLGLRRLR